MSSLVAGLLAQYRAYCAASLRVHLDHYSVANAGRFDVAIKRAARAERDATQRRHSHQRRLPQAAIEDCCKRLLESEDLLSTCSTFAELHSEIERCIGQVRSVGPLMVYDTALRLGSFLRLRPEEVYLHAGTREGAMRFFALLGIAGQPGHARTLARSHVEPALSELETYEIEDFLCVAKEALRLGQVPALPLCCSANGRLPDC